MRQHKEKLSGVFAPVVTPVQQDELRLDDLRFNLRKLNESRLTGYFALGSNGEFKSLSDDEQIRVLEVFAEEKHEKVVMVGTGCESTRQTIEKSTAAGAMGFDYVSVVTPHYFAKQMDGPTLQSYFERIAEASPMPVLLYNVPGFTGGVQIPVNVVRALSGHPNIVGMKDSSPAGPGRFLKSLSPDEEFAVLAGSANFFYPTLHLGAVGGILSLANIFPEECCDLYQLFLDGKYDEARALHFRLARLNETVSGAWGVAGVKATMELSGYRGGEVRHPLKPLSDEEVETLRNKIRGEDFLTH